MSLKSKYLKLVLLLTLLNITAATTAYVLNKSATQHTCIAKTDSGCGSTLNLIIVTLSILVSVILWYLAFKRHGEPAPAPYDMAAGPLVGSQLAHQKSGNGEGLRKLLTASGWLIAIGTLGFVILILLVVTVIGFG